MSGEILEGSVCVKKEKKKKKKKKQMVYME